MNELALQQPIDSGLRELALFAGAGGGILGGKLLGWRTVCAVEWDAYARDVLVARQNDGCLAPFPVWDNVCSFAGHPWRGIVDVVSGGFPCQDISCAGKGAGIDGERSGMWVEMARIIGEVRPRFVFVENSPMLTSRGLGTVLGDLASLGYDARWGVLGAVHAGAPHKRDRIWILAYPPQLQCHGRDDHAGISMGGEPVSESGNGGGEVKVADTTSTQNHAQRGYCECGRNAMGRNQEATQQDHRAPDNELPCGCCGDVADTLRQGLEGVKCPSGTNEARRQESHGSTAQCGGLWWRSDPAEWPTESRVGRVVDGVAARVDRLKAIGNGQVPAVVRLAWTILETLKDHEA